MRPSEIVFEVHEDEEGGYYTAAVGYDIITQGDSWDDLKDMVQDAVLCHFDDGSAPVCVYVPRAEAPGLTSPQTPDFSPGAFGCLAH